MGSCLSTTQTPLQSSEQCYSNRPHADATRVKSQALPQVCTILAKLCHCSGIFAVDQVASCLQVELRLAYSALSSAADAYAELHAALPGAAWELIGLTEVSKGTAGASKLLPLQCSS